MNIGYSHHVTMEEPEGITIEVPDPNKIIISAVTNSRWASLPLKSARSSPPEPYKGKGIKYADEVIRRKEGKTGVKKK